jgi:hypothetical protein
MCINFKVDNKKYHCRVVTLSTHPTLTKKYQDWNTKIVKIATLLKFVISRVGTKYSTTHGIECLCCNKN